MRCALRKCRQTRPSQQPDVVSLRPLQMCMKNPTELVSLDAPLNAMFRQMAHGTAGGLKKMGEMYLIVQLYTWLQFVNLSVVTITNIKDLGRRIDYLGDFGDGLGHTPYILGSMPPNDHLRGALNLARGVIMQAVFDGAVDLPCGGDVALVADYLMEMQVAATSISAYNPGLVGRGIWEGAEIGAGEDGGGVGNVDSAEEMSRKGEVVIAGLRAAYQKRFEQELEEKHEIMLIVFMKMYKKVQEGLTTTGVPEFYNLADLPLNKMICPSTK